MLVEPHPINGMEYADLGDGVVKVTDHQVRPLGQVPL